MRCLTRNSVLFCCGVLLVLAPLMLPTTTQAMFSITIYFGKAQCAPGVGICRIDIGAREAGRRTPAERAAPTGEASATVEEDKKASAGGGGEAGARETVHLYLKIEMKTAPPKRESVMPVSEDLVLDAATSKALGHKSITVLKGDYKIDYSKNKFGSLLLKITARD
jgi:hypothetical protein